MLGDANARMLPRVAGNTTWEAVPSYGLRHAAVLLHHRHEHFCILSKQATLLHLLQWTAKLSDTVNTA